MSQKFSAEGTYQNFKGESGEFNIDYENDPQKEADNNELLELLDHPWRLVTQGGKYGVKGVKRFFGIIFIFLFTNLALLIFGGYEIYSTEFTKNKLMFFGLLVLFGLVSTAYAGYRAYQFVILDTFRVIYENLTSFFQKISDIIIDKSEKVLIDKEDLSNTQFSRVIAFGSLLENSFSWLPNFLKRRLVGLLERVPFVGMLKELKHDVVTGDKALASQKLHGLLDNYFSNFFSNNNTRWVLWMLPLNVIIMLFLIFWKLV